MYVCLCKGITDRQLRSAVHDGASSFRQVAQSTGCSTQCGQCACMAKEIVEDTLSQGDFDSSLFSAA
ncbi:MAG: (2Fe-2S)-binding protein [Sinobacterium sp.]|nr:(2Fe-2S)-binding protein [Sinobacterium sp.]